MTAYERIAENPHAYSRSRLELMVYANLDDKGRKRVESVCTHLQATSYYCMGEWIRVCEDCGAHVNGEGGVKHG